MQIRERDGGSGYCGQSDPRLHFGLGPEDHVGLLEVRWPDGGLQYLENTPADRIVTIRQDPENYAERVAIASTVSCTTSRTCSSPFWTFCASTDCQAANVISAM